MLVRRSNAGSMFSRVQCVLTKADKASSSHCSIEQVETVKMFFEGDSFVPTQEIQISYTGIRTRDSSIYRLELRAFFLNHVKKCR